MNTQASPIPRIDAQNPDAGQRHAEAGESRMGELLEGICIQGERVPQPVAMQHRDCISAVHSDNAVRILSMPTAVNLGSNSAYFSICCR